MKEINGLINNFDSPTKEVSDLGRGEGSDHAKEDEQGHSCGPQNLQLPFFQQLLTVNAKGLCRCHSAIGWHRDGGVAGGVGGCVVDSLGVVLLHRHAMGFVGHNICPVSSIAFIVSFVVECLNELEENNVGMLQYVYCFFPNKRTKIGSLCHPSLHFSLLHTYTHFVHTSHSNTHKHMPPIIHTRCHTHTHLPHTCTYFT